MPKRIFHIAGKYSSPPFDASDQLFLLWGSLCRCGHVLSGCKQVVLGIGACRPGALKSRGTCRGYEFD